MQNDNMNNTKKFAEHKLFVEHKLVASWQVGDETLMLIRKFALSITNVVWLLKK